MRTFVPEATAEQIARVEQNTRRFVEVEGVLSVSVSTNRHRSANAEGLDHVTMIDIRDDEALRRLIDSDVRTMAVDFAGPLTPTVGDRRRGALSHEAFPRAATDVPVVWPPRSADLPR